MGLLCLAVAWVSILRTSASGPKLPIADGLSAADLGPLGSELMQGQTPKALALSFETDMMPIDLATALQLAGVNNPQILLARQRVLEALAVRQLAAAQILPSIHLGTSFDDHNGNLQQSNGNILKVDRNSVYVGAGAIAIAAGSVGVPGIGWNLNLSNTIYQALASRQLVEQARFADRARENEVLRKVALAYTDLLGAEGKRALALLIRQEARAVYQLTADWAKAGAGRQADKDRAATELAHRDNDVLENEGAVLQASAQLAELLNMSPAIRLHVREDRVVPAALVPDPIPLSELLAIALLNRPELRQRQAGIRQAFLALGAARMLPFSPNLIVGLSYGGEGGGSNLVHQVPGTDPFAQGNPRFGLAAERLDFDAVAFWALQNLGVGNLAMIREARSRLQTAQFEFLATLDQVRAEVTEAHVGTHARFAQIRSCEEAVRAIVVGYQQDLQAIKGNIGRPIELLDSLRLLGRARLEYLEAIIRYNQAQLELYVALGQPPADTLARPVPKNYLPPSREDKKGP